MAIVFDQFITDKKDSTHNDGTRIAEFVLSNGTTKKLCKMGHLPENEAQAIVEILKMADHLYKCGVEYTEEIIPAYSGSVSKKKADKGLNLNSTVIENAKNFDDLKMILKEAAVNVEKVKSK